MRPLVGSAFAVAVFNRDDASNATAVAVAWADVGIGPQSTVTAVSDLWASGAAVPFTADGVVVGVVAPHDTVVLRVETTR